MSVSRRGFLKAGAATTGAVLTYSGSVSANIRAAISAAPDIAMAYVADSDRVQSYEGLQIGKATAYGKEVCQELTETLSEIPASCSLVQRLPGTQVAGRATISIHGHHRPSAGDSGRLSEIGLLYPEAEVAQTLWRYDPKMPDQRCNSVSCTVAGCATPSMVLARPEELNNRLIARLGVEQKLIDSGQRIALPKVRGMYVLAATDDVTGTKPDLAKYRLVAPFPSARPDVRELMPINPEQHSVTFEYLIVSVTPELG